MSDDILRVVQISFGGIALWVLISSLIDLRKGKTTAASKVRSTVVVGNQARVVILIRLFAAISMIIGVLLQSPLLTLAGLILVILASALALNFPKS
ncbi:MAG: hypothetical protein KF726_16930 [Anaerolineae bacterium]|nr:hypothetical protein [Anaerolineae bacterium]